MFNSDHFSLHLDLGINFSEDIVQVWMDQEETYYSKPKRRKTVDGNYTLHLLMFQKSLKSVVIICSLMFCHVFP